MSNNAGQLMITKALFRTLPVALLLLPTGLMAEHIRCELTVTSSTKSKQYLPTWIEFRRDDPFAGAIITDSLMEKRGIEGIRADVSRENKKILALTWVGYSVQSGFNRGPVRPRFRLSYRKSNQTMRLNHVAPKGGLALSAKGSCTTLAK